MQKNEYYQLHDDSNETKLLFKDIGIKIEYYPRTKKTKAIYTVDREERKDGEFKAFHENGRTKILCTYKKNSLEGKYFEWDANGKLIKHRVYRDDEVVEILVVA